MKKLEKFGYLVFGLSICLSSQGCEIQEKGEKQIEEKITVNQPVNQAKQQGPVSLNEILKKIENLTTEDKKNLAEILILRIKYILVILAENAAKEAVNRTTGSTLDVADFDMVMLEIRTKLEALASEKLSFDASNLLTAIDTINNQESPMWNIKLINCFMDLRYDFTQKFFHVFGKKLIALQKKYQIKFSESATFPDKVVAVYRKGGTIVTTRYENMDHQFEKQLKRDQKNPFCFFSIKNTEDPVAETMPNILYAMLKNRIKQDKLSGPKLLTDLLQINGDFTNSNKALELLKKTCSTFEASITNLKKAQPLLVLYKKLLMQLDTNKAEQDVLDALLMLNSRKMADLEHITEASDMLKEMHQIITTTQCKKVVKSGTIFLEAPHKNNFENTFKLLKNNSGFYSIFGENFITKRLKNSLVYDNFIPQSFIDNADSADKALCSYVNNAYLLHPLMKLFIENLEKTGTSMQNGREKKEKKKNTLIKKLKIKQANSKKKTVTTNTPLNEEKEIESLEQIEEISETISPEINQNVTNAIRETCTHLKLKPKFSLNNGYALFEAGTTTPSGVKNGLIIVSPENRSDCTITADTIDFGTLKRSTKQHEIRLDGFHKLPFKALENPKILGLCQQYDIDNTDSNLLQNICNLYHITIPTTIKTMLLLPCSLKITGAEADSAGICFKNLCNKITTEKSTNFRQPGLHEGAIVCLLEEDKSNKNKFHIYHLDFHGTEDTKKFVGKKKFGS